MHNFKDLGDGDGDKWENWRWKRKRKQKSAMLRRQRLFFFLAVSNYKLPEKDFIYVWDLQNE